jgi:hypothetical protein
VLTEEFAELATLLVATLDELTAMLEATLDATEETTEDATELDDGATLDATELALLELVGIGVPQPMGSVDNTISSIHTSAVLPLKLWKPNMA